MSAATLVIDNYDSFTFNLVQYLGELGDHPLVYRNDQISIKEIEALKNLLKREKDIILKVPNKVIESISEYVYNLSMGARPISKILQKNIENKASEFIIKQKKGELNIELSEIDYE